VRHIVIEPKTCTIRVLNVAAFDHAVKAAGLVPGRVDHGMAAPGIGIVVFEYSMFEPADGRHWFAIGSKLYGGNALLYGVGDGGETIDLFKPPPVIFFPNAQAVEKAITAGTIERPTIRINGVPYWTWPGKRR